MGITETIGKAKAVARALLESPELPSEEEAAVNPLEARLREVEERLKIMERVSDEYFEVIERIERERDQWKDMFFTQANEHQNAQAILQKMLGDSATHLRSAIKQLNVFRKGAELDPVVNPRMLEQLPTDLPEKYGERMRELAKGALAQTNGLVERAKIAASAAISSVEKKS